MKYDANCIIFEGAIVNLYDETRPFIPREKQEDLSMLCSFLVDCTPKSRKRIELVDLGAGTGRIAIPLALQYARFRKKNRGVPRLRITCIDLSLDMLKCLKTKWNKVKDKCGGDVDIVTKQEDIRKLGGNGPEFDAGIVHWIFHVIEDWRVAAYAIDQSIRKSGRLFLITEQSPLYSAIDGDLRDLTDSEHREMHEFWRAFLVERTKFDSKSPRRRLGSLVVDDRIDRLLYVLGWGDAVRPVLSKWKTRRSIRWLIEKIVEPRCFTNMQLYVDNERAEKEYKEIASRLRTRFVERLDHEWEFETSIEVDVLKRREFPTRLGGHILLDVARATVGRRWEKGIGRVRSIGPIWDRLVRSTWLRLNGFNIGQPVPLGGTTSGSRGNVLGMYVAAPSTVDLSTGEQTVTAAGSAETPWSEAHNLWDDLTGGMEMREPFAICVGYSQPEQQRIVNEWERGSRVHPPLHLIAVGADAKRELSRLTSKAAKDKELSSGVNESLSIFHDRWCTDLLFSASNKGIIPYEYEQAGPKFLAGIARLIDNVPITYVFPATGGDPGGPVRGFLVGATDALDGETARLLWSLGETLFSGYEEVMSFQDQEQTLIVSSVMNSLPAQPQKMKVIGGSEQGNIRNDAIRLLKGLDEISMLRHVVIGNYVRFEPDIVESLSELARRIQLACTERNNFKENFLIWAPPGQGKTYLVEEIARMTKIDFIKTDLKDETLSEDSFTNMLKKCQKGPESHLCLVDEIHARSSEKWPYEKIYGFLDWNETKPDSDGNKVFVLIGSTPPNLEALKFEIKGRHAGGDLLRRVSHEAEIPKLSLGDRLVITLSQLKRKSAEANRTARAIEKLALLYILMSRDLLDAGKLTSFIAHALERLPRLDDKLKFRDLFEREDHEKELEFWSREKDAKSEMGGQFLYLRD